MVAAAVSTGSAGVAGHWAYWIVFALMMVGLYIVVERDNLVKKVMGLNIFQSAAIFFYIVMSKVRGGTAPILLDGDHHGAAEVVYSNPLPHVLMLTAIVVGVANTSLALALVLRIQAAYGTAEEDEIVALDLHEIAAEDRAIAAEDREIAAEDRVGAEEHGTP